MVGVDCLWVGLSARFDSSSDRPFTQIVLVDPHQPLDGLITMLFEHELFLYEGIRFAFYELLGSHCVLEDYSFHLYTVKYVYGSLGSGGQFFITLAYSLTVPAIGLALTIAHAGEADLVFSRRLH